MVSAVPLCGIEEQREVIGHQHPADEQELHLLPQPLEPSAKAAAKPLGEEKGRGGAGGMDWKGRASRFWVRPSKWELLLAGATKAPEEKTAAYGIRRRRLGVYLDAATNPKRKFEFNP